MLKKYQKEALVKYTTRSALKSQTTTQTSHEQSLEYQSLVQEIKSGTPFEYVVNTCDFLGCTLYVDKHVLIPRVETEILAETVINSIRQQKKKVRVLDLCTGSGAIGLSIKKNTDAETTLVDICPNALAVASKNARINQLKVDIIQSDLFEHLEGQTFDVVVCNPPYISEIEYNSLDKSVKDYEPQKALLAGKSGLEVYEKISKDIVRFLNPGAKLFFEIGYNQADQVQKIFSNPCFTHSCVKKDYSGLDRFFFLEFQLS